MGREAQSVQLSMFNEVILCETNLLENKKKIPQEKTFLVENRPASNLVKKVSERAALQPYRNIYMNIKDFEMCTTKSHKTMNHQWNSGIVLLEDILEVVSWEIIVVPPPHRCRNGRYMITMRMSSKKD